MKLITENETDGKLLPVADPFLETVKNTFFDGFFPVATYRPGVIFMSSNDIYMKFHALYPTGGYAISDVAQWMHEKGFRFKDVGEARYEWMLLPSTD